MLSERKKALINWVNKKAKEDGVFLPSLRLHRFLFFYECFSKVEGDDYNFDELRGYKRGPVFGDVYREVKFNTVAFETYINQSEHAVDEERAKRALFLVRILGNDLSDFTHNLDIWKTHEKAIMGGTPQLPLSESDFSEKDVEIFISLLSLYPANLINEVEIKEVEGKAFLFPKKYKFKEEYYDVLYEAAIDKDFHSPVYVDVDEEGLILE